jgi:hypothetical protein
VIAIAAHDNSLAGVGALKAHKVDLRKRKHEKKEEEEIQANRTNILHMARAETRKKDICRE